MAKQSSEEKVIPLGIVFMVMGFVIVCTAVTISLILLKAPSPSTEPVQAASLPTTPPDMAATNIPLLPETLIKGDETDQATGPIASETALTYVQGQPERIIIPSLNLDAPVNSVGLIQVQNNGQIYYQWEVPGDYHVGWHNTSAPLGKAGNTVLNGHHNIEGEVFRDLANLESGDEIVVYGRERPYTYTVSTVEILPERDQTLAVRMENAHWISPTDDERLTLVTCWPYEDNSHRLIVVAFPAVGADNRASNESVAPASSHAGN
jgi:sortase A